jgi:hypothetical protein
VGCYFESLVCLDHIIKCIDCQIVVNDLLLTVTLLIREFEVNVYYLLYLLAAFFYLQEAFIYLINHLPIKRMVFTAFERVLIEDRLRELPNALLDVLYLKLVTVTRIRMSWSR